MVTQSLPKYLDVLLYDRNIIGFTSESFGNLRKFSENVRNVCMAFGNLLEDVRVSPESVRKSSENLQKSRHMFIY